MLSTKFDSTLTLSIPHNSLPPNPLRVHHLEQFDTLSVYRASLREQVASARNARSANLQRLHRHEKSNNPETQASRSRKTSRSDPFHRSPRSASETLYTRHSALTAF